MTHSVSASIEVTQSKYLMTKWNFVYVKIKLTHTQVWRVTHSKVEIVRKVGRLVIFPSKLGWYPSKAKPHPQLKVTERTM